MFKKVSKVYTDFGTLIRKFGVPQYQFFLIIIFYGIFVLLIISLTRRESFIFIKGSEISVLGCVQ